MGKFKGFYKRRQEELGGVFPEWKHGRLGRQAVKAKQRNVNESVMCCEGCGKDTDNRDVLCDECLVIE